MTRSPCTSRPLGKRFPGHSPFRGDSAGAHGFALHADPVRTLIPDGTGLSRTSKPSWEAPVPSSPGKIQFGQETSAPSRKPPFVPGGAFISLLPTRTGRARSGTSRERPIAPGDPRSQLEARRNGHWPVPSSPGDVQATRETSARSGSPPFVLGSAFVSLYPPERAEPVLVPPGMSNRPGRPFQANSPDHDSG